MLLPLDLLHSFRTVITVGSMSRACRSLGRTQAAVSLQIQRLEDLAGGKLIERRTRPLQTTPRGELVLQHARDMLEMNAAFVTRLKDDEVSGSLRVGIPNDFATRFLPRVLAAFVAYTSLDLSGLSVAVENGLGVTALSQHTLPTPLKSLILTDSLLPPLDQVEIGLLCKEESLSPRALSTLRDSFIEALDSRLFQT